MKNTPAGETEKPPVRLAVLALVAALVLVSAWNAGLRLFLPKSPFENLLRHGVKAYAEGRMDLALEHFLAAENKVPYSGLIQYLLAQTYEAMGREEDAVSRYQKAISFQPDMAEAHYNLAVIYHRRNEPEAVRQELYHALRLRPDFNGARLMLGGIYVELGMYPQAVSELEILLKKKVDRTMVISVRNLLARAYIGQEQPQQARQQWEEVLRLDSRNQEAQEQLRRHRP